MIFMVPLLIGGNMSWGSCRKGSHSSESGGLLLFVIVAFILALCVSGESNPSESVISEECKPVTRVEARHGVKRSECKLDVVVVETIKTKVKTNCNAGRCR